MTGKVKPDRKRGRNVLPPDYSKVFCRIRPAPRVPDKQGYFGNDCQVRKQGAGNLDKGSKKFDLNASISKLFFSVKFKIKFS